MARERMEADANKGPLRIGGQLLKYTIRGLLGRGGYAWVYEGYDSFLDVEVAIKVLHRPGGVTDDMLRRGQAEAKFLYRLRHRNVVEVIDAGIADAGLYIVMELLRGPTVRSRLAKGGPMSLGEALPYFAQVSDGIGAAHALKAIHRDIKPENLVVQPGNEAKVLDFGIVKVIDAVGGTTERDVVHGTVLYLSPEQLNGVTATPRSDVYALGLTLFEALYGKHALFLKNERPTQAELPWLQMTVTPPRLDELDARIPREVGRLVQRMLVKDPGHRVGSMREVSEQLRACAARLDSFEVGLVSSITEPTVMPPPGADSKDEAHPADPRSDAFDAAVTIRRTPKPAVTSQGTERIEPKRLLANVPVASIERPENLNAPSGAARDGQPVVSADESAVRAISELNVQAGQRVSADGWASYAVPGQARASRHETPRAASVELRLTPRTVPPVASGTDRFGNSVRVLDTPPAWLVLKWVGICALAGAAIGGLVLSLDKPPAAAPRTDVSIVALPSTATQASTTPTASLPAQPVAASEGPLPSAAASGSAPNTRQATAAPSNKPPTGTASTRAIGSTRPLTAAPKADAVAKPRPRKTIDKLDDRLRWVESDLDKEEKNSKSRSSVHSPADKLDFDGPLLQ